MKPSNHTFLLFAGLVLILALSAFSQIPGTVSPREALQGDSLQLSVFGNWKNMIASRTRVTVYGIGVETSNVRIANDSTIHVDVVVRPHATVGSRDVRVWTMGSDFILDRVTLRDAFLIRNAAIPTIVKVEPYLLRQGDSARTIAFICEDTRFSVPGRDSIGIKVNVPSIRIKSSTIVSNNVIALIVHVSRNTPVDYYDFTVEHFRNGSLLRSLKAPPHSFRITHGPKGLASMTPGEGKRGESFPVTVTGLGTTWKSGPYANLQVVKLIFSDSGVSAKGETVINDTLMRAQIAISPNAAKGPRLVRLASRRHFFTPDTLILPKLFQVGGVGVFGPEPQAGGASNRRTIVFSNPVNTSGSIRFDLNRASPVGISVFNALGQAVFSTQEAWPAGKHTWRFPIADFPNGVYVFRTRVGNTTGVKRMLIGK